MGERPPEHTHTRTHTRTHTLIITPTTFSLELWVKMWTHVFGTLTLCVCWLFIQTELWTDGLTDPQKVAEVIWGNPLQSCSQTCKRKSFWSWTWLFLTTSESSAAGLKRKRSSCSRAASGLWSRLWALYVTCDCWSLKLKPPFKHISTARLLPALKLKSCYWSQNSPDS